MSNNNPVDSLFLNVWKYQITEHFLFAFFLTEPNVFKHEAKSNYEAWAQLQCPHSSCAAKRFANAVDNAIVYFEEYKNAKLNGSEIGLDMPTDLIDHILEEQQYVSGRLKGTISRQEEVEFLRQESVEHIEFLAKHIDPQQTFVIEQLVKGALEVSQAKTLDNLIDKLKETGQVTKKLCKLIESNVIKSGLPIAMIKHEEREQLYVIARLQQLYGQAKDILQ